jgi:hypothetical protein
VDNPVCHSAGTRIFLSKNTDTGSEAHRAAYLFVPGVNWPGSGDDHSPPSSAQVNKEVRLVEAQGLLSRCAFMVLKPKIFPLSEVSECTH